MFYQINTYKNTKKQNQIQLFSYYNLKGIVVHVSSIYVTYSMSYELWFVFMLRTVRVMSYSLYLCYVQYEL